MLAYRCCQQVVPTFPYFVLKLLAVTLTRQGGSLVCMPALGGPVKIEFDKFDTNTSGSYTVSTSSQKSGNVCFVKQKKLWCPTLRCLDIV